jgi:hypothetical protein
MATEDLVKLHNIILELRRENDKLDKENEKTLHLFKSLEDATEKAFQDSVAKGHLVTKLQDELAIVNDLVNDYVHAFTLAEFDLFDKKFLINEISRLRKLNTAHSSTPQA